MITIGLDLSLTSTGVVVWERDEVLYDGLIKTDKKGLYRLHLLRESLETTLREYRPKAAAVENYSMGAGGRGQVSGRVFSIGEWGGLARMVLWDHKVQTIIVPPATLKMYVALKGNASKEEIMAAVEEHYGYPPQNDDLADAYGLAVMAGAFFDGYPTPDHKKREKALQGVEQVVFARKRKSV